MASEKIKTFTDSNFDEDTKPGRGARGFLGRMVRPVSAACADRRRAGRRVRGSRAPSGKMNVDENPNVPSRFRCAAYRRCCVLKDGELVETIVGLAPKEDIARMIERHL